MAVQCHLLQRGVAGMGLPELGHVIAHVCEEKWRGIIIDYVGKIHQYKDWSCELLNCTLYSSHCYTA